ncbi:MAG: Gfo/Idh/MocA family oxidoreductase [Oscillospiraceae bacterium]
MKKSAIIGCGGIAQVHAKALKNLSGVKLVACGDIHFERAEKMAAEFSCTAYHSLEEMLAAEEIDVLHICTPHYLHTPMAQLAEKLDIAVFTEKPPAITPEQWAEFSQVKVPMGICFQNRYNKSVQYVRELLTSGKAGKILGARAFVTWSRGEGYYVDSGWRGSLTTEGGGVLINQSIHTMDLLVYLMGTPISCEASCCNRHLKNVIEVEDTLEAQIHFDRGVTALFYATTAYSMDSPVLLELHCEHMVIKMEEERVLILHKDKTREELVFSQPEALGKSYWGNGHFTCIGDFYEHLEEKKAAPIGIPQVEDTVKLMLATYRSARETHREERL